MSEKKRIYAWDDESISSSKRQKLGLGTFANKEKLKQIGLKFDTDMKRWFTETEYNENKIKDLGIIMDEGIALGQSGSSGHPLLMNFERKGKFLKEARFKSLGKDRDGLEIFTIDMEATERAKVASGDNPPSKCTAHVQEN